MALTTVLRTNVLHCDSEDKILWRAADPLAAITVTLLIYAAARSWRHVGRRMVERGRTAVESKLIS